MNAKAKERAVAWQHAAVRLEEDTQGLDGPALRAAVDRLVLEFKVRSDEASEIAVDKLTGRTAILDAESRRAG